MADFAQRKCRPHGGQQGGLTHLTVTSQSLWNHPDYIIYELSSRTSLKVLYRRTRPLTTVKRARLYASASVDPTPLRYNTFWQESLVLLVSTTPSLLLCQADGTACSIIIIHCSNKFGLLSHCCWTALFGWWYCRIRREGNVDSILYVWCWDVVVQQLVLLWLLTIDIILSSERCWQVQKSTTQQLSKQGIRESHHLLRSSGYIGELNKLATNNQHEARMSVVLSLPTCMTISSSSAMQWDGVIFIGGSTWMDWTNYV